MFGKLLPVVEGDAAPQGLGQALHATSGDADSCRRLQAVDLAQPRIARFSLDQRHQAAATPFADDRVSFPVAITAAAVDDAWPSLNADAFQQLSPCFRWPAAATQQGAPLPGPAVNPVINRLTRQPAPRVSSKIALQAMSDLIWRPAFLQFGLHILMHGGIVQLARAATRQATLFRQALCLLWPVPPFAGVAIQLSKDGAAVASQEPRDLRFRRTSLLQSI